MKHPPNRELFEYWKVPASMALPQPKSHSLAHAEERRRQQRDASPCRAAICWRIAVNSHARW